MALGGRPAQRQAGRAPEAAVSARPPRASARRRWSAAARCGPGEVTLAHRGVLFLDELPEFNRSALEALRLPMQDGEVVISRAAGSATMPARSLVVAAMNPCPCGHHGDPKRECICPDQRLSAYRARVSGPLADRFDLRVEVPRAAAQGGPGEPSDQVAARVAAAHAILTGQWPPLDGAAERLLAEAAERLLLSARGRDRMRRVAGTSQRSTNAARPGRTTWRRPWPTAWS